MHFKSTAQVHAMVTVAAPAPTPPPPSPPTSASTQIATFQTEEGKAKKKKCLHLENWRWNSFGFSNLQIIRLCVWANDSFETIDMMKNINILFRCHVMRFAQLHYWLRLRLWLCWNVIFITFSFIKSNNIITYEWCECLSCETNDTVYPYSRYFSLSRITIDNLFSHKPRK